MLGGRWMARPDIRDVEFRPSGDERRAAADPDGLANERRLPVIG
jgi:hypothetical protein